LANLDLSSNHLGADGARAIRPSLRVLSGLTRLNLRGNTIGNARAIEFARALKISLTRLNIDIDDNSDSDDHDQCLVQ